MLLDTPFMPWIDHLPEVGDPIRKERAKLLEVAEQAAELERHALALRAQVEAGQAALLTKVMQHWTLQDIQRASDRADSQNHSAALLRHIDAHKLRDALRKLDGTHLAAEALRAFHEGEVIGQHNLLSTATDDERRAALERVLKWWNLAGVPVYDRLAAA